MVSTTRPRPSALLYGASGSIPSSQSPSAPAMVAPPNAPASTPTSVIPIWTVDRKRSGASARSSATRALWLPLFDNSRRRALRADMTASSDMEKTPFMAIRTVIARISRMMVDMPFLEKLAIRNWFNYGRDRAKCRA